MDAREIQQRITDLRLQKGVSELKMSRDLGHSDGYIHHIAAGRSLPSMQEFLYICEYFGVTPSVFFDFSVSNPVLRERINSELNDLSEADLLLLLQLIHRIKQDQ